MVHDGEVSEGGPSFPLGTEDHAKVSRAIAGLLEKQTADQEKG
jgi:hypothetical protein